MNSPSQGIMNSPSRVTKKRSRGNMNSPPQGNMNSPSQVQKINGFKTQYIMRQYDGSYDNKTFTPTSSESTEVDGYECVVASPNSNPISYFYRMDRRAGFRGDDRNTYFGINPKDIFDKYKHTHLFVVKPNTPIVLINMNLLKNVEKLMESASDDVKMSIRKAFPIDGNIVKRVSEPPSEHGGIDHDRRVLEYICSLQGIDGYYVTVGPLHPEIGFCKKSLQKLDDVTIFRARPNEEERNRSYNETRKKGLRRYNPIPFSFKKLSLENLQGGKRKPRKTTQKKRKTQRKK
jgi:hypothetical protein